METAFLLLPFIILLVALIEFGWYFLHEHTLQFATREGMRLALVGGVSGGWSRESRSVREDSIIQTIQRQCGLGDDHPGQIISKSSRSGITIAIQRDGKRRHPMPGIPADYMRVVASYDHEFLTPLIGEYFTDDNTSQNASARHVPQRAV